LNFIEQSILGKYTFKVKWLTVNVKVVEAEEEKKINIKRDR